MELLWSARRRTAVSGRRINRLAVLILAGPMRTSFIRETHYQFTLFSLIMK
jgi:hypothetical protein